MSSPLHPVWGHDGLRAALNRAVGTGTLPATILLHGPRGSGKQRLALWLAQLERCEARGPTGSCEVCRSCRLALRVEHPDIHWYFPVARPSGSFSPEKLSGALEDARWEALAAFRAKPLRPSHSEEPRAIYMAAAQALRKRALRPPSEGGTQVFIVADAETLVPQESSPEAANVLLKLLEEPPSGTRFILTSSEPGKLLPTIRSRSLPIAVTGLPMAEVERFLVTVAGQPPEAAARAARMSHGAVGRALGFLADEAGEPGPLERLRTEGLEMLEAALSTDPSEGYRRALAQRPWGARGLADLLDFLEAWLRDLLAIAVGGADHVLNVDHLERLTRLSRRLSPDPTAAIRARETLEQARLEARGNVNPQLLVAGLLRGLRRTLLSTSADAAR